MENLYPNLKKNSDLLLNIADLGNLMTTIASGSIEDVSNDERKQIPIKDGGAEYACLTVGGITKDDKKTHLRWIDHKALKIGDEINIRVIESETVDAPDKSSDMVSLEKHTFDFAKKTYFDLKDKYE